VDKNNLAWQIEFKSDAPNVLELIDKNHPGVFTDKVTDTGNAVNISFGLNYEDYTERTSFNFELTKTKNLYIITIESFMMGANKNAFNNGFLKNNFTEIKDSSGKQRQLLLIDTKLIKLLTPPGATLIE
jgi:hypothetical protein